MKEQTFRHWNTLSGQGQERHRFMLWEALSRAAREEAAGRPLLGAQ